MPKEKTKEKFPLGKKLFVASCIVRGYAQERAELDWNAWEGDFMTQAQWQETAEKFQRSTTPKTKQVIAKSPVTMISKY